MRHNPKMSSSKPQTLHAAIQVAIARQHNSPLGGVAPGAEEHSGS